MLEAKPGPGYIERFYYSKKTGFMVRQESQFESTSGKMRVDIRMKEHSPFDGLVYPHLLSCTVSTGEQEYQLEIRIEEIKHNIEVDEARFKKP